VVWSDDVERDLDEFLTSVDADFYDRTARALIEASSDGLSDEAEDLWRKDASSQSRLLWHHGIETLVMMLGAYVQAPGAVHAYFLKCRTEDALELARALLQGKRPAQNRITDAPFTLVNLLKGIHLSAVWRDVDDTLEKFARALGDILRSFAREEHRWEYNSIKHGLRAHHGKFGLAIGIQDAPGVPASADAMEMVGYSRDASFFNIAKPLRNATNQASRVNFALDKVSVAWSLEKVLCDLQLLSLLIGNTVSALRIVAGASPGTVVFKRPADADDWWDRYMNMHAGPVPTARFGPDLDVKGYKLPTGDDVMDSYRKRQWKW
jgi:hypothetical protein